MDDNIIKHYSNEATFTIQTQSVQDNDSKQSMYDITLNELEEEPAI